MKWIQYMILILVSTLSIGCHLFNKDNGTDMLVDWELTPRPHCDRWRQLHHHWAVCPTGYTAVCYTKDRTYITAAFCLPESDQPVCYNPVKDLYVSKGLECVPNRERER